MIIEKAYAKLNLVLDVENKREDGYHNLNMINIPLNFYDVLEFELKDDITLKQSKNIENNLIIETVKYIRTKYNIEKGVAINLEKNIPIGSGLGGGSADIAATIRGLDKLWELNLNKEEKEEIALRFGSDTLFCLYNQPAYVYGRGDKIEFLEEFIKDNIYLINSDVEVSTKNVFNNLKIKRKQSNFFKILDKYKNKEKFKFLTLLRNDLTKTTLKLYPEIKENIKRTKTRLHMTGSGSTFFLIVPDEKEEKVIKRLLKKQLYFIKTSAKY